MPDDPSKSFNRYTSSFYGYFRNKRRVFYYQEVNQDQWSVKVYDAMNGNEINSFLDDNATLVWNQINFYQEADALDLFGITHPVLQQKITDKNITCLPENWNNNQLIEKMWNIYLSKNVGYAKFQDFFSNLQQTQSAIIELRSLLQTINIDIETISSRQLQAWKQFITAIGCVKIPYKHKLYKVFLFIFYFYYF